MKNKRLQDKPANFAGVLRVAELALATLIALCVFSISIASAQSESDPYSSQIPLVIGEDRDDYALGAYTYVIEDPDKNLTLDDVLRKVSLLTSDQRNTRKILDLGYVGDKTWLAMKIRNVTGTREWLLNFGTTLKGRYGFVKSIEVYRYGDDTQNPAPELIENRLRKNIPVTLEPGRDTVLVLAIESVPGVPLTIGMEITTADYLISQGAQLLSPLNMLMIFMCGMAFFFVSVCLTKHSWDYLPFSGYYMLLAIIFYWNNASIFGDFPIRGEILPLLLGMLTICSIGLTKIFLVIRSYDYAERYVLNGLSILVFAGAVAALLPIETTPLFRAILFYGPSICAFLIMPVLCFAQAQGGKEEAYPLIWAWLFLVTGLVISGAALAGSLKLSGLTLNAFWIMLVPQAAFFIFSAQKKIEREQDILFEEKAQENKETLSLVRLRHTKESAEQSRLLKVIEREREILTQMREREVRRSEEMRMAKNAADEANRAKSAFLAVVSHEIRTPMTGVMGMVRLLLDTDMSREQKDYVMTIQDSGDSMLTLLNDILDFEKIERGRMDLEYISFDLPRLIQGVSTLMSGHAAQKGIALKTVIGDDVPRFVVGDPNRLRQVLLNLTGNALKFTSDGHVILHVQQEEAPAGTVHSILFAVQDNGIGISAEAQKNLFTPFSQADSSISRKFGGTGLGLAICKGLIEAMGGKIKVSSKEGQGSTFSFTLKLEAGATAQSIEQMAPAPQKTDVALNGQPHILIVDDNEINRKVVTGLLKRFQCTSDTAQSAEQALRMIKESHYDLVLMDIQLPNMKGDEAAIEIRGLEDRSKANVPIIALSGNVMQEDIDRFNQAGMNDFVAKPIDPDRLKQAVLMAIGTYLPAPEVPAEDDEAPGEAAAYDKDVFDAQTLGTLKTSLGQNQLQELLDGLVSKMEELIGALQTASDTMDFEDLSARAHELKGMAGNFGLTEISAQAAAIEKNARSQDSGGIVAQVAQLPDAKTRAETALAIWANH